MRLLRWIIPVLLLGLAACGPAKKSVYPPTLSIQQLVVLPDGQWRLTVRIQNNSYAGMDFTSLDGQLQVAELVPVRLHASFEREIPELAGDVIQLNVLPTAAMSQALQAIAARGSAGALAYRISGSTSAKPEQEAKPRSFDFNGNDWISPVPGIPDTYR
ncbi:hypothetical protein LRK24_05095 [Rhodanobacter denitrificans]|uniref:hypothetical protein n=1 Tax=Rhodanobacter denitrificans TaxID=666685 RepID=UPI000260CC97|nr:hypothetical protein [Rhodanobacter denitrificans]EIM00009.1 hypothetical protein UUC_14918 [Rhodanobacter denitrificans]UJM91294.1 hypothetical protein LRK24_05095 [Rhodanobacter denitrificans]